MTLRDEILAKCSLALIASRDEAAIAAVISVGRTRPSTREIGDGAILETLGVVAANAFLDVINTASDYRYVKRLVQDGTLHIGKPLVQASVQAMVLDGVLTQVQADALCALGVEPDPVTAHEVAQALEGM